MKKKSKWPSATDALVYLTKKCKFDKYTAQSTESFLIYLEYFKYILIL